MYLELCGQNIKNFYIQILQI